MASPLTTTRYFIFLGVAVCHGNPTNPKTKIKGALQMTLYEYYDKKVPNYYDGMYLDGYTP